MYGFTALHGTQQGEEGSVGGDTGAEHNDEDEDDLWASVAADLAKKGPYRSECASV